jgi:hypothetical protein
MARVPTDERIRLAKHASVAAAVAAEGRVDPYVARYGKAFFHARRTAAGAKQRCTNPYALSFENYGGRGITFDFPSVRSCAEWVLDNIGPRPSEKHSLDRVDNDQGYTPGNLRWATRSEQARNKRVYRRTNNGERIRKLREERPDLTYETLRLWIKQGVTDEEIIGRRKYARPGI